jgi:cyclophilin family peptidyl-prolyl cis-trans isomerase
VRVAALAAAALLAGGCGGGGDDDADAGGETTASGCRAVDRPDPRDPGLHEAPDETLDPAETTRAVVVTNCGEFTITLDPEASPNAASSFAELAEDGYFDDTVFHRIVPGFVIQGGDPTASGTGGPGYTTVDPPDPGTEYTQNVVAMAKAGNEPPGAAGSQFFVVTAEAVPLEPDYAVIGTVTDGQEVVQRIGALGNAQEQPTETVLVERVEIERG